MKTVRHKRSAKPAPNRQKLSYRPLSTPARQSWHSALSRAGSLALLSGAALTLAPASQQAHASGIDGMQLQLTQQLPHILRWENVRLNGPYLVGQAEFSANANQDWRAIRLAPGQKIQLRLPRGEFLRIQGASGSATLDDVQIWRSNGSALALRDTLQNQQGALVLAADLQQENIITLARADNASGSVELGLFVSRQENRDGLAPYRQLQAFSSTPQQLRTDGAGAAQSYWPLSPTQPQTLTLRGPARYVLQARWQYAPDDKSSTQQWQVSVSDHADHGKQIAVLPFTAGMEHSELLWLDGKPAMLSAEKSRYFELPAGEHRIKIESDGPILARVLGHTIGQASDDYRLPELNANLDLASAHPSANSSAQLAKNSWDLQPNEMRKMVNSAQADLAQQAARRLWQDNRQREGGALAADAMQAQIKRWQDVPAVRTEAEQIVQLASQWRDLLPLAKEGHEAARFAWFSQPRLLAIGAREQGKIIAAQHEDELLKGLNNGHFIAIKDQALRYALPPRSADSSLQLALQGNSVGSGVGPLLLQFDDGAIRQLSIQAPAPDALVASDTALSALQMQQLRYGEFGGSTVAAAFSRNRIPAALVAASSIEIPLPRHVQHVKIWRAENQAKSAQWLAVKIRESQTFALSEAALLPLLERQSTSMKADLSVLLDAITLGQASSADEQALASQLQPLARIISAQSSLLTASVVPPAKQTNDSANNADSKASNALAQQARSLAQEGNYLPALEKWAEVLNQPTDAALRDSAEQGQIQALLALGENFLAEQMLKQRLLYGSSHAQRQQAAQALHELYAQDERSQLTVASAHLLRDPSKRALQTLVPLLQANDQGQLALMAGLLLPAKERPLASMLTLALKQQWPRLFEQLRASLPNNAEREYWRAQQLAQQGKFLESASALQLSRDLAQAAKQAQTAQTAEALAQHLQQGLQLAQEKSTSQAIQSISAPLAERWAAWQDSHPGTRTWQEIAGQINDFAGAVRLYAINRDTFGNSYLANPQRPVKLRVLGPIRLRVEARPLHAADSKVAQEGWLKIAEPKRELLWPVAITQNWPVSGLQIVGNDKQVPGHSILQEIALDAGWHELEISGEEQPMLINVQTSLAELALPVLPLLNEDTLRGQAKPMLESVPLYRPWYAPWRSECLNCSTMLSRSDNGDSLQLQRWRAREAQPRASLSELSALPLYSNNDAGRSQYALQHAVGSNGWQQILTLAGQNIATTPGAEQNQAVLAQMQALLWRLEHHPQDRQSVLAQASQLQEQYPQVPGLGSLMERMLRNSDWIAVASVQNSAGQRSRPITNWEPENPALRVRRALLRGSRADEYLLSGGNRLVLSLFNIKTGQVKLALQQRDTSGQPTQALVAQVQLDNGAIQNIPLTSAENTLDLSVHKGQQSVKVWIKNAISNQFLSVRIVSNSAAKPGQAVIDSSERFYQVATHQEPIKLTLAGPVWLRLDQWRDGQTHSRYRLLKEEWNKITLAPRPEQKEALFRLFTRQVVQDKPVTPGRLVEVPVTPVAAPFVELPTRAESVRNTLVADSKDVSNAVANNLPSSHATLAPLPLGGQESGTWSTHATLSQQGRANTGRPQWHKQTGLGRDAIFPKNGRGYSENTVVETGATYRLYDETAHNWYRGDVFARRQQQGGNLSLGANAAIVHEPNWQGLLMGAEASLLLQNGQNQRGAPGQAQPQTFNLGALAYIKQSREISPILNHQPAMTVRWRQDNDVNDVSALTGENEQQDSSSRGRKRNLSVELGDTINYRPRLDTMLSAQAKLMSGKSILPDVLATQLSAKQMVGRHILGLQYDASAQRNDNARMSSRVTQALSISLGSEIWLKQQHRLEFGINLKRDLTQRQTSGAIGIVLHFGNGRGYRDFQPEEIMFRDLRRRRAPEPTPLPDNSTGATSS